MTKQELIEKLPAITHFACGGDLIDDSQTSWNEYFSRHDIEPRLVFAGHISCYEIAYEQPTNTERAIEI